MFLKTGLVFPFFPYLAIQLTFFGQQKKKLGNPASACRLTDWKKTVMVLKQKYKHF
jgi:hypothetical protein